MNKCQEHETCSSPKNSTSRPSSARRLLKRLKSPLLFIASQLTPQSTSSTPLVLTRYEAAKKEIEQLSEGRLALAEKMYEDDKRPHRLYDHECGNYFWTSLARLRSIGASKACAYCNDPTSLNQIGGLFEIQRFVRQKSLGNAYLLHRNVLIEIDDIYDFYCARCRLTYQAPFSRFVRFAPETNACPSCEAREGCRQ